MEQYTAEEIRLGYDVMHFRVTLRSKLCEQIEKKKIFGVHINYKYLSDFNHNNWFFNYEIEKDLNKKITRSVSKADLTKFINTHHKHVIKQSTCITYSGVMPYTDVVDYFERSYHRLIANLNSKDKTLKSFILIKDLELLRLLNIFPDKTLNKMKLFKINSKTKDFILNKVNSFFKPILK